MTGDVDQTRESVTLLDVARAAEVSKTTVSNVFSFPDRVRPELREHVEAVARQLGFAGPDPRGRMLASGRVNAIGIVPPAEPGFSWVFRNEYMAELFTGVSLACEERGVALTLLSAKNARGDWQIQNAVVDGIILSTPEQVEVIRPYLGRKQPVVLLDAVAGPEISSVGLDNRAVIDAVLQHLLELGHRRFSICTVARGMVPPIVHRPGHGMPTLRSAYSGDTENLHLIAERLDKAGLSIGDMTVIEACGTPGEKQTYGTSSAEAVLDNLGDATAAIVLNGDVVLPLIDEARRRGIQVPRDLSVIGNDDRAAHATSDPAITVISTSVLDKGRRAAELLFASGSPQQVTLPFELKVRGSTAAPRTR